MNIDRKIEALRDSLKRENDTVEVYQQLVEVMETNLDFASEAAEAATDPEEEQMYLAQAEVYLHEVARMTNSLNHHMGFVRAWQRELAILVAAKLDERREQEPRGF